MPEDMELVSKVTMDTMRADLAIAVQQMAEMTVSIRRIEEYLSRRNKR
jgi:hypothetical protein